VRRHSSRGKRTKQSLGSDSPRLDRHPSLRFSTTRLPSGRVLRPQPAVKMTCTLAVSKSPATAAGEVVETRVDRKESSGSNASSIGTCHDLGPSVSAYSMTRGGHPDGNRSSSSADTAAMGGVEGLRDDVFQKRLAEGDQGLLANRAMDVSHINLLRTAPSEHELSGSQRRFEDGLDVQPSNTVDRLSPASCRRRPQTPEVSPAESPNPRRDVVPDPRQVEATFPGTADEPTDVLLIGVSMLTLLLLTSPSMVVGLIVAMCTGRGGPYARPVSVETTFSLHVVAYVGALVRPLIYFVFSRTFRQSLLMLLRCRRASNR